MTGESTAAAPAPGQEPSLLGDRLGATVFLVAAVARTLFLAILGHPPARWRLDVNAYLELALNLAREGTYGSAVSTDYPPLYPMFIAPAFLLESNAARFFVIYAMHGLLLAAACASLYPMLRSAMGSRSAWLSLAAAQLLAGGTYHAMSTRTEVLFTALICFTTAAVWHAFQRGGGMRWALVGLCCGAAIACRRTGLALPVAVGLVVAVEAFVTLELKDAVVRIASRGVVVGAGLTIGLVPEAAASAMHGGSIETYSQGVVGSHLSPITRMWGSPAKLWLAVQTSLRQPLYGVGAFLGAPLVVAAVLTRKPRIALPTPVAASAAFAALVSVGLAAMSSLHILRYAYGNPDAKAFHLYPRYMDPVETSVVLATVALAAAAFRGAQGSAAREHVRSALVPWVLPVAILTWVSGYAWRLRGGRFAPRWYFEETLVDPWYHVVFMVVVLLVIVFVMAWWSLGKYGTAWTVLIAAVVGWSLSLHILLRPGRWDIGVVEKPPILTAQVLEVSPTAPIAVPVRRRAPVPRQLYAPAWRSDHPIYWPRYRTLKVWLADHPDGFVLTRSWEREPGHLLRLELVGATNGWRLWAPVGRETVPDSLWLGREPGDVEGRLPAGEIRKPAELFGPE